MQVSRGFLENDNIYRGDADYNDYEKFDGFKPSYRRLQRTGLSQDSGEEPFEKNILDEFSTSSFFDINDILSASNSKATQSYVKIVNFDDLKSETETYFRKDFININCIFLKSAWLVLVYELVGKIFNLYKE